MGVLLVVVLGLLYCCLAALLADRAPWVETLAQSFVPYVAVPAAVGVLTSRWRPAATAVLGAGSSALLVLAFYATTALDSSYAISLWGLRFWALAGLVVGAGAGLTARGMRPRRDLVKVAEACGVEHPGLIDAGSVEVLDGRTSATPLREVYGYAPDWGLPSAADRAAIARIMNGEQEDVQGGSAPPSATAVG